MKFILVALVTALTVFVSGGPAAARDTIEFLNGSQVNGTVKQIRKDDRELDFEARIGTRTFARTYAFGKSLTAWENCRIQSMG